MQQVNQNKERLVRIQINDELLQTAKFLAKQRLVFEYPRAGYGDYNKEHLQNLVYGYLGELAFLNFITNHFKKKYQKTTPNIRFEKLKSELFEYNLLIGKTDAGFDFKKNALEIDVKTYGTNLINDENKIFNFNLLIDQRQAKNHQATIYIQTFIVGKQKPEYCILSGFTNTLPKLNISFPKPAHALKVPELFTMNELLLNYF